MSEIQSRVFLIDAMSLIYRAYFAFNRTELKNSKGLNTSAILGFANMLFDILKNENPEYIAVCFDSQKPTFRHEEFQEYKAQRESMPDDIAKSLPIIKELLQKMNIPIFELEGYEADDIIGTIAKKAENQGFLVYMVTTDKDFGQLVSDKVFIYKTGKASNEKEILGVKEICEKYEIKEPSQLIDILGLWGDSSDNVPGVPGIGEVKAKKLIKEFQSIENLIANADKIKDPKLKEAIKQNSEQALFSKRLVTIATDVPIEVNFENLKWTLPPSAPLMKLLSELEFRQFSKRFFEHFYSNEKNYPAEYGLQGDLFSSIENKVEVPPSGVVADNKNYKQITTLEEFANLIENLQKQKEFAFNLVTTGTDPLQDEIVGIGFCYEKNNASYLPLKQGYLSLNEVSSFLSVIFEQENLKITHNLKYQLRILKKYGISYFFNFFDLAIAHYVIEPEQQHELDFLVHSYLSEKITSLVELVPSLKPSASQLLMVDNERLKDIACEYVETIYKLKSILEQELVKHNQKELFEQIEMPLVEVLADIEEEGMNIDVEFLQKYSEELGQKINQIEKEIFKLAGTSFNIASPKQLGQILFDKLKITDKPQKTKTKQYSTSEEVLLKLKNTHPIVPLILEHRTLTKLKNTYIDALPKYINPKTKRIHTMLNQTVTSTGRLSSTNPNLQNIPIRTEEGQEIRKAFVPRNSDYVIVSADYSQIELRVIAALSNEERMIEDFKKGIDIHRATAARLYRIDIDEVNSQQRRNAKTVNFGIIYGISAYGLAERLDIPKKEAQELIEEYFIQYPNIKKYINQTIEQARKVLYVETFFKRRRYIPNINSNNSVVRGFAERVAINAPIQGTAADIIKIAMINIYRRFNKKDFASKLIMQVHDELIFDVHKSEINIAVEIIEEEMKRAFPLNVPIEVSISIGKNWLEAH